LGTAEGVLHSMRPFIESGVNRVIIDNAYSPLTPSLAAKSLVESGSPDWRLDLCQIVLAPLSRGLNWRQPRGSAAKGY